MTTVRTNVYTRIAFATFIYKLQSLIIIYVYTIV